MSNHGEAVQLHQRQVHLDFHTAPEIPSVGKEFDGDGFAATFRDANVQSVTIFAKCHHGYSYHPTGVGEIHPGLSFDLTQAKLDALHAAGINAPIYITVGWDELVAARHPEWLLWDSDGRLIGRGPSDNKGWRLLDLATPYADYVLNSLHEVLDRYHPVDGIFLDIVRQEFTATHNPIRRQRMKSDGADLDNPAEVAQWSLRIEREFMARCAEMVRESNPKATLFFNSRLRVDSDPQLGTHGEQDHFTHIEIESLPSGEWGYLHFPLTAAYFQALDRPLLGMTGIFHTAWGDFGSVKTDSALRFECGRMLAAGATCSVGDQLPPRGTPDPRAYRTLGRVFKELADLEPWTIGAVSVPEVGILAAETGGRNHVLGRDSDEGAVRMLLEAHRPFHLLDRGAPLNPDIYRVVIVPDVVPFDDVLAKKLVDYLDAGGTAIFSDRAGLTSDGAGFHPIIGERLGLTWRGAAMHSPDFAAVRGDLAHALPEMADSPQVLYDRGSRVEITGNDVTVLAYIGQPYFDRTPDRFMSHRHWPLEMVSNEPAITRRGGAIYLHSPIFRGYRQHAVPAYREIVAALLSMLSPSPLVESSDLPSTAEVGVLRQTDHNDRLIVHLLHAVPQRRGAALDIIEDVLPLRDVRIGVRRPNGEPVNAVSLAPSGDSLTIEHRDNRAWVTVPEVRTHQVLVVT